MKKELLSLREQIYTQIFNKIVEGHLLPGEKINESFLAEEFNVSRGPIREALRLLENERLVRYETNKGCSIPNIEENEVLETYIVRAHLEILAIDLCQGILPKKTVNKMNLIVNEMKNTDNFNSVKKLFELDEEFHKEIVKSANNKTLLRVWESLKSTNIRIFTSTYKQKNLLPENQSKAHERILEKINNGDTDGMKEALRLHYIRSSYPFK